MEVPTLWVKSELQLPVYATVTATQDPKCIWDLHHSHLRQCRILNPLSEASERTRILIKIIRVLTAFLQQELQGSSLLNSMYQNFNTFCGSISHCIIYHILFIHSSADGHKLFPPFSYCE